MPRPSLEQILEQRLRNRITEALDAMAKGEFGSPETSDLVVAIQEVERTIGRRPTGDEMYDYIFGDQEDRREFLTKAVAEVQRGGV